MLHPACLILSGFVLLLLSPSGAAGPAFTATVLHRYFGSDTSQAPTVEVDLVARRADGSTAEVKQLIDGKIIGNKSILDLTARKRIAVQIAGNSITTYPLPAKSVAHYRVPKTCGEGMPAGRLLGFEVVKVTRSARAEPAGRIVRSQEWEAPALGCFTLKRKTTYTSTDRRSPLRSPQRRSPASPGESLPPICLRFLQDLPNVLLPRQFARRPG